MAKKREYLTCAAYSKTLEIEELPNGMHHGQEAINPRGEKIIFMGVDEKGVIWFLHADRDGLYAWNDWVRSKVDFMGEGFVFLEDL